MSLPLPLPVPAVLLTYFPSLSPESTSNLPCDRLTAMDSPSSSNSVSALDLVSALLKGKIDLSNSSSGSANELASILFENRELAAVLATSVAVLIGCVVVLIWRRSSTPKSKAVQPPKPLIVKEPEPEVDDGKKKVTIFFGTQTGTAEGFAKVCAVTYSRLNSGRRMMRILPLIL